MLFKIKKCNSKKHNSKHIEDIPDDRNCSECEYAIYVKGDKFLSSGYTCNLNPKKPIAMGLWSTHSQRKQYEEQQYT